MKTCTSEAIILGHKNFGEKDRLVFLYTEELGKIKVIAKGARRLTSKYTGHLETLNYAKVGLYFGPKNTILTEIITIKNHKQFFNDFDKLSSAFQIAESTNKLIYQDQVIDGLIPLFNTTMKYLIKSKKPHIISITYITKLLNILGMTPDYTTVNTTLDTKYRKFFNFITHRPLNEVENIQLNQPENSQIKKILQLIIAQQIDQEINSLNFNLVAAKC